MSKEEELKKLSDENLIAEVEKLKKEYDDKKETAKTADELFDARVKGNELNLAIQEAYERDLDIAETQE